MTNVYKSNAYAHAIGWSAWHFEWCTKYRRRIFYKDEFKNLCLIAIHEAARRHRIQILESECEAEHVHLIAKLPLTMSPVEALQKLKGFSARLLFETYPKLRYRYPDGHIWSPGKFSGSVGHITLEVAKAYVKNQEAHHTKFTNTKESPPRAAARGRAPTGARAFRPGRTSSHQ